MSNTVEQAMRLWRAFEKTDPAHTKAVSFGRKFTSIDAHWQIKRVTEVLGPVGGGWGYDSQHTVERFEGVAIMAMCDVTLWWVDSDSKRKNYYGPFRGCSAMVEYTAEGKPKVNNKGVVLVDDDAPKKAMTDALTKGLSHLGVSADVFLGLFDDNKYVAKMTREFTATKSVAEGLPADVTLALQKIHDCDNTHDLEGLVEAARQAAAGWTPIHRDLYAIRVRERRAQLAEPVSA